MRCKIRQDISEDGAMMLVEIVLHPRGVEESRRCDWAEAFARRYTPRIIRDRGGNPVIQFMHPLYVGVGKKE